MVGGREFSPPTPCCRILVMNATKTSQPPKDLSLLVLHSFVPSPVTFNICESRVCLIFLGMVQYFLTVFNFLVVHDAFPWMEREVTFAAYAPSSKYSEKQYRDQFD